MCKSHLHLVSFFFVPAIYITLKLKDIYLSPHVLYLVSCDSRGHCRFVHMYVYEKAMVYCSIVFVVVCMKSIVYQQIVTM